MITILNQLSKTLLRSLLYTQSWRGRRITPIDYAILGHTYASALSDYLSADGSMIYCLGEIVNYEYFAHQLQKLAKNIYLKMMIVFDISMVEENPLYYYYNILDIEHFGDDSYFEEMYKILECMIYMRSLRNNILRKRVSIVTHTECTRLNCR